MASHPLMDEYLAELARRLPADTVDELSDGLTEACRASRAEGKGPEEAARAAIAGFGRPDVVVDAFVAQAPGRRAARLLLATGPVVGICWATGLVTTKAWTWPGSPILGVTLGIGLVMVVAMLIVAASSRHSYHRTRLAGVAAVGVLMLDVAVPAAVLLIAPTVAWPLAIPVFVCMLRFGLVLRGVATRHTT